MTSRFDHHTTLQWFAACLPSRRFIVYALIGACCAALDFALFTLLLHWLGAHYLVANAAGAGAGIVSSFVLNRRFNFRQHDEPLRRFAAFFIVGLLGLALSSLMLFVGVDLLRLGELPVKLVSIVVVALVQYMLNRDWSFAPASPARPTREGSA